MLVSRRVKVEWSLAKITDLEPFRGLARRIREAGIEGLRRTVITAERRAGKPAIGTREASDRFEGYHDPLPLEQAKARVRTHILQSRIAPARPTERRHVDRILDTFYGALGDNADQVLTDHWRTAADRIISVINVAAKAAERSVTTETSVEFRMPFGIRLARSVTTSDLHHTLAISERNKLGYEGWRRNLYSQVWFDSDLERRGALVLDNAKEIEFWVRLHSEDLPISWAGESRDYNPDFLTRDTAGDWWVVETKADKDLDSASVIGKAEAAREWANRVNVANHVEGRWRYLLVGESDVDQASGSWLKLRSLGR